MPTGTPTTLELAKEQLKIAVDDPAEDARLARNVAAANGFVVGLPVAEGLPESGDWPPMIQEGATLLAVRLFRRKNSPAGKEKAGADGAVFVASTDPDIALLLELGPYGRLSLG